MVDPLAAAFVFLVVATAGAAAALFGPRLPPRSRALFLAGLPAWLLYVGALSWSGAVADPALRPPAIAFVVGPAALFVVLWAARSAGAGRLAAATPLAALIGFQIYRIGVELVLHRLWQQGLVPRMLTFEGANLDLWVGASAPLAAWLSTRGRAGRRFAAVWTLLGLASLANVVLRSALTAPGPLHLVDAEVANRAIGLFPYTFIAGFLAPLAAGLHVLALRTLRRAPADGPRAAQPPDPSITAATPTRARSGVSSATWTRVLAGRTSAKAPDGRARPRPGRTGR